VEFDDSYNYPYDNVGSDYDSVGCFQQRVSGYPISSAMVPELSAEQFLARMVGISGWQTMDVGTLCQKVQVSAYPDRYVHQRFCAASRCLTLASATRRTSARRAISAQLWATKHFLSSNLVKTAA
jgi:hypothetical protein